MKLGLIGLVLVVACGSPHPSKEALELAAKETYEAEHLRCVDKFRTNPEIDACRADVRKRWPVRDGGAQ